MNFSSLLHTLLITGLLEISHEFVGAIFDMIFIMKHRRYKKIQVAKKFKNSREFSFERHRVKIARKYHLLGMCESVCVCAKRVRK